MKRRTLVIAAAGLLPLAGCLDEDSFNEQGTIDVVIDGESVDLTQDRLQAEHAPNASPAFHFHEFDEQWHMEGDERVTVAEGIDLLPYFAFAEEDGAYVVVYDGTRYDGGNPDTAITFLVNDEEVDPTTYELQADDHIRVEIETDR